MAMPRNESPQSGPNENCPHCGSDKLFEVECGVGPHHARLGCTECKRHIRYLPAPWTPDRALNFGLHFGKHKGQTIGDLIKTNSGRSYLAWLAENVGSNAAKAAAFALRHCTQEAL
jgi:hypothetical protein